MKQSYSFNYWPWYFITAAFESLLALVLLLRIPSEGGLSPARLALAGMLLFFFVLGIVLAFHPMRIKQFILKDITIYSAAVISLAAGLALFFLRYSAPEQLLPVYIRLRPVLWYFTLIGLESTLFFLVIRNGFGWKVLIERRNVYTGAFAAVLIILSIVVFVYFTGLGITKDPAYWGEPGVPLQGWQVALALSLGFFCLLATFFSSINQKKLLLNLFIPIGIWIIAVLCWSSVPMQVLQNSFYAPITPPTFIPYPYSDAGAYDTLAQSLLIGQGYFHSVPPRPFYVLFLALLHSILGQDYLKIMTGQSIVLGLFPVMLYFLGKKIHSPAAGVAIALFAIFRELNSLWISSNTRVVNSRILTTDFPTALGISLLCLASVYWFERRDSRSALLAGGSMGLLLLLRTQAVVILPILLILYLIALKKNGGLQVNDQKNSRNSAKNPRSSDIRYQLPERSTPVLLFMFSIALAITPWLIHNYTVVGKFAFDDPNQMGVIYSQYAYTGNLDFSQFDIQADSLGRSILKFTLENPAFVAGFVTNHFLNTEIGGLLVLPLIQRFDGIFAPVNLYWLSWDGSLDWYNFLLLLLYLVIIAIGLSVAWYRLHYMGLIPIAINMGYALSNGIARFSSWRYNLPVDWVAYFYFGIGALEILGGLAVLFGAKREVFHGEELNAPKRASTSQRLIKRSGWLIVLLVFLIGGLPWFAKGFATNRYASTPESLIARMDQQSNEAILIKDFLAQPNALIKEGMLLYPRFYRRGLGLSSTNPWPVYAVRDFPRLGFVLLNQGNIQVIFPTHDPIAFQHGEDVIVLGCQKQDYLEARIVFFTKLNVEYMAAPLSEPCQ